MHYEGTIYRPPSEALSFILQATVGCSHNLCTYCDMYRDKRFRERGLDEVLTDIGEGGRSYPEVSKVFVADGDALVMDALTWKEILTALKASFPKLRRISCYATAQNLLEKDEDTLGELRELGLSLLYIGPESGDDITLKRIVKGATFADHAEAAGKAHRARMKLSVIMLLGAGGVERSEEHARESARLITEMDPAFLSALTLTVLHGTPIHKLMKTGRFQLPAIPGLLRELRTMVGESNPTRSIFRTNHASNYLPIEGRLPKDREKIVSVIDQALAGEIPLRPEYFRGL
jgi:radical SAM superfamily enzyme YgiQ (UPF0313 family)